MPTIHAHEHAQSIDPQLNSPGITVSARPRSRNPTRVPRPPHPFVIFRSEMMNRHEFKDLEHEQRPVPRIVSDLWKDLPEEQKEDYRRAAEVRKKQLQLEYADYRYQPGPDLQKEKRKRTYRHVDTEIPKAPKVEEALKRNSADHHASTPVHISHSRIGPRYSAADVSSSSSTPQYTPTYSSMVAQRNVAQCYPPSPSSSTHASSSVPCSSPSMHSYPGHSNDNHQQHGTFTNNALTDAQLDELFQVLNMSKSRKR
ncbi:hypothetical protein K439DRAFT_1629619 [Ramaria rubella]|nr:hypothetical protein K439DRAFT_1629619 [Ramaria rubella]